jgi:hypothetical protein
MRFIFFWKKGPKMKVNLHPEFFERGRNRGYKSFRELHVFCVTFMQEKGD